MKKFSVGVKLFDVLNLTGSTKEEKFEAEQARKWKWCVKYIEIIKESTKKARLRYIFCIAVFFDADERTFKVLTVW